MACRTLFGRMSQASSLPVRVAADNHTSAHPQVARTCNTAIMFTVPAATFACYPMALHLRQLPYS